MKNDKPLTLLTILFIVFTATGCKTKEDATDKSSSKFKTQFTSGFEGNVHVSENKVSNKVWTQTIVGVDSETGAKWPEDLPGDAEKSIFIYLLNEKENLNNWIESEIKKTSAYDGSTTRALYQAVKKPGKSHNGSLVRNQFGLVNNSANVFNHIRVKYRIKLQENLETVMPGKSWRQLMEIRGRDNSFRITMTLNRFDSNAPISWKIEAQEGPNFKDKKTLWVKSNFNKNYDLIKPIIPIGKWFNLEFELISRSNNSGKFICRIDGKTIYEHIGETPYEKGLHTWHMFKVYASENALKKGPHYQWIDDVEITVY